MPEKTLSNRIKGNNADGANLFQVVVFYRRPVVEELELQKNKKLTNAVKTKSFVFPYYSREIFRLEDEAIKFVPNFIEQLVETKKLPPEIYHLDENGHKYIKEDELQVAIAPLVITSLERIDEWDVEENKKLVSM